MTGAAPAQRSDVPVPQVGAQRQQFWRQALAHGPWLLAFVAVFAPTIVWLWQRWTISVWQNAHGLFIPFVVAYLIRTKLKNDPVKDPDSSKWGFLFLVPGLLLVLIDSAIKTQLLSALGLVICLPGLSLLLLGARRTKALTMPWGMAAFMLPVPAAFVESLQLVLRQISATGAEHIVRLLQITVFRDNLTLHLGGTSVEITDACSGFSTLYAMVTMACILAYATPSRRWAAAILLAAIPAAVGSNVLRCALLTVLVETHGSGILATSIHPLSGIITAICAACILLFVWSRSQRSVR